MRNVISGSLIAAALGTAMIAASAFPASAQVARPQSALAFGDDSNDLLIEVRARGGGGGGFAMRGGGGRGFAMRGGGGHGFAMRGGGGRSFNVSRMDRRGDWNRNRWNHRHTRVVRGGNGCGWNGCGWGWGSGLALGYGLGYGLGYAYGYPYYGYGDYGYSSGYGYGDYAYAGDGNSAVAYCMSRFRTYKPATGTYTGNDGLQHSCP